MAIYITQDGVGEYFDSYGKGPNIPQIEHFLRKNAPMPITQYGQDYETVFVGYNGQ